MRPKFPLAFLLVSFCAAQAQVSSPGPAGTQPVAPSPAVGGGTLPDPLTWPVSARDWNTITREFFGRLTNALTGEVTVRPHTVVQVGDGMNYLDGSGAWQPSQDRIELMGDGGAAAVHGPNKVFWSPAGLNNDAALTIITASNRVFQARVLGVYYFDPASGESKLLAAPSDDAVAELQPPNQIVYRSAFNSDLLKADLRYTYTKGAFESEVILTAQPKLSPADCGFDPAAARLQVRHQWLAPMMPRIRTVTAEMGAGPDLTDQILDFGDLWFPRGHAFVTDGGGARDTNVAAQVTLVSPGRGGDDVPVGKEWQQGAAWTTLTESVTWKGIAPKLTGLPLMAKAAGPPSTSQIAAAAGQGPPAKPAASANTSVRLAGSPYHARGVVLDYMLLVSGTHSPYTFEPCITGNTNTPIYVVTNSASFSGTVTFQPGCLIKFVNGGYLLLYGGIVCNGSLGSPSILTSLWDDQYDGIGGWEQPPAGTIGDVGTGLYLYYIPTNVTVEGMCIRYATTAIEFEGYNDLTHTVSDTALYACQTGVYSKCPSVSIVNSACRQVTNRTRIDTWEYCGSFTGSFTDGSPPSAGTAACPAAPFGSDVTLTVTAPAPDVVNWFVSSPPIGGLSHRGTGASITLGAANQLTNYGLYVCSVNVGNPFGWTYYLADFLDVVDSFETNVLGHFLASTNGKTSSLWAKVPNTNPPQPDGMAWNTNCLVYGMTGFTAISQLNSWTPWYSNGNSWAIGQLPVTALTRRHGYARGHGMGIGSGQSGEIYPQTNTFLVWFCTADQGLVTNSVVAYYTHNGDGAGDYSVLLFDHDLPASITPMHAGRPPKSETIYLVTSQLSPAGSPPGGVAAQGPSILCGGAADFWSFYNPLNGGDSGSPYMLPTTNGVLVFFGANSTTGPSSQMQADMDYLSAQWQLNPANYKMQWYTNYPSQ